MGNKRTERVVKATQSGVDKNNLTGFTAKRLGSSVFVALLAFVAAVWLVSNKSFSSIGGGGRVTTLYNQSPKVTDLAMFQDFHKSKFYWGTYRPHLYFGMKTRSSQPSIVSGLMWYDPHYPDALAFIRHTCEQNDFLSKYGWLKHDGSTYGKQEIHDRDLIITTEFVKDLSRPLSSSSSSSANIVDGGDWVVRLSAKQNTNLSQRPKGKKATAQSFTVLMFYLAFEPGLSSSSNKFSVESHSAHELKINGISESLGSFTVQVNHRDSAQSEIHWAGLETQFTHNMTDQTRAVIRDQIRAHKVTSLPDAHKSKNSNLILIQMVAELPFQGDIVFRQSPVASSSSPHSVSSSSSSQSQSKFSDISSITAALAEKEKEFDTKFENVFQLAAKSFNEAEIVFAKAALSNLLGGIGYFSGKAKVTSGKPNDRVYESAPLTLFTAVPSRPFFPRGFLWDEGFHQLLVQQWDQDITRDVLAHWFDLMNVDGWIPREVILGQEAESKVPEEFLVQKATNANPPTFLIALERMLQEQHTDDHHQHENKYSDSSVSNKNFKNNREFLKRLYPRLQTWFQWFRVSQAGEVENTFRWRGRDATTDRELNPKTLTSGLDDYPRASHPSDDEKHVDLYSWMSLASKIMYNIALIVEQDQTTSNSQEIVSPSHLPQFNSEFYLDLTKKLDAENLKFHHWNNQSNSFCDFGNHTEFVKLSWYTPNRAQYEGTHIVGPTPYMKRTLTNPKKPPKPQLVNQFGYISLFPLLLGVIDEQDPLIPSIMASIEKEELLMSMFGLRSLSKSSSIYLKHNTENDGPYWRGPVWINMNYLAVGALHRIGFSSKTDPETAKAAQKLYATLRQNIINNMVSEYKRTGYIWEQYDVAPSNEAKGKGSHPFTGWSSLIVLMMAEKY